VGVVRILLLSIQLVRAPLRLLSAAPVAKKAVASSRTARARAGKELIFLQILCCVVRQASIRINPACEAHAADPVNAQRGERRDGAAGRTLVVLREQRSRRNVGLRGQAVSKGEAEGWRASADTHLDEGAQASALGVRVRLVAAAREERNVLFRFGEVLAKGKARQWLALFAVRPAACVSDLHVLLVLVQLLQLRALLGVGLRARRAAQQPPQGLRR
jgi:hypothetical protein